MVVTDEDVAPLIVAARDARTRWAEAAHTGGRREAALALAQGYLRWGLGERAAPWVAVVARLEAEEPTLEPWAPLLEAWQTLVAANRSSAAASLARLGLGPVHSQALAAELSVGLTLLARPEDGFAALERALRVLRRESEPLSWARVLLEKGRWLIEAGRGKEATVPLRRAQTLALEAQRVGWSLEAAWWLAVGGGKTRAATAVLKVLEAARAAAEPVTAARACRFLADQASRPAAALAYFREAVDWEARAALRRERWSAEAAEADGELLRSFEDERRSGEARHLARLSHILSRSGGLAEVLDAVYPVLQRLVPADIFGVALWVPDRKVLDYAYFLEAGVRTRVGTIGLDSPRSLGAWCFRERQPVRINDIDREYGRYLKERSQLSEHQPQSMLFLPLEAAGERLGIVTAQSFGRHAYGPDELNRLTVVAGLLALRLYGWGRSDGGVPASSA